MSCLVGSAGCVASTVPSFGKPIPESVTNVTADAPGFKVASSKNRVTIAGKGAEVFRPIGAPEPSISITVQGETISVNTRFGETAQQAAKELAAAVRAKGFQVQIHGCSVSVFGRFVMNG
jgi:hypothetical protein